MSRAAVPFVFKNEAETSTDENRGHVSFIARAWKALWMPETSKQTLLQLGIVIERVQVVGKMHEGRRAT